MKKYIPAKGVAHRYNVGISTVWQWTKEGVLPAPVKFGKRCTRWDCDQLDEHDKKIKAA
ncbi:MAG: AlpA family transcriptional regulator [Candidatus Thiodiazotropha taylori]|nr:AlpA family transcriptional regulator [Candidatus Thiodiazotropha taylori]MCG8093871.1 AlpA family transcriptional regulator [Candidatus Thiodiazotropha endolucinida]MCG7882358.1 AlpA family transcriptional regulator [Candidatus Thiodiazotropha taylori]MCG7886719.1 AlpA family transcriptional regulator [Candidatus Thiodiazotropha taylori]MCG7890608.1 AlpA family transcriptional regulator [Candidatus Thiodiazotropha taylori]